jgi:hypothetical protein
MELEYLLLGLVIQVVTSLDDTITKLPIILGATRTRKGKLAFVLGSLPAVLLIIAIVQVVSAAARHLTVFRYLAGGVVLGIALFMLFKRRPAQRLEKFETALAQRRGISAGRFISLLGFGFAITFLTSLDDSLAFIPLLGVSWRLALFSIIGILLGTGVNMLMLILFAERLQKIRHIRRISAVLLFGFGILILAGLV